jgi:hypothetical protein
MGIVRGAHMESFFFSIFVFCFDFKTTCFKASNSISLVMLQINYTLSHDMC